MTHEEQVEIALNRARTETSYDHSNLEAEFETRDREFARLRRECPVPWDAKNRVWYVTRHGDLKTAATKPEIFSSAQGVTLGGEYDLSFMSMDAPEHPRQRRVVARAFTPRMAEGLTERIEAYTVAALEQLRRDGGGNFVRTVAMPVPLLIIMDILGMPHEDYERVRVWTDEMIDTAGREDDEEAAERGAVAYGQWGAYVEEHIALRKKHPAEDVLSKLAQLDAELIQEGDRPLDEDDLHAGDEVVLLFPSANRDERVFADPDRFDICRQENDHLAFGAGPHICIGAHLARREINVVLRCLVERVPELAMVGDGALEQRSNILIDGVRSMSVQL